MYETIGCLVVLVASAVAVVALKDFITKQGAADVRVRAARIHSALGRLSHKPGDQVALDAIGSAVGDRQWLLRPSVRAESDLWVRAIGFAFANVGTSDGQRVLERLVVPLAPTSLFDAVEFLKKAVEAVRQYPDRRDVHAAVRNAVLAIPRIRIGLSQSEWLYQQMLELVKEEPKKADVAVLALDFGRWHCSRMRPDGKVTVYDEQMIQNDIAVRRAGS